MALVQRTPLSVWLRTEAKLHSTIIDDILAKLRAEECFEISDVAILRTEVGLAQIFTRVTAAKIGMALDRRCGPPTVDAVADDDDDDEEVEVEQEAAPDAAGANNVQVQAVQAVQAVQVVPNDAADHPSTPSWWTDDMHQKMAEVFFLTEPRTMPTPGYYNDRLAFGSLEYRQRFPNIAMKQMLSEGADYVDSQLADGGAIRARFVALRKGNARIEDLPRAKRKPDLLGNGKVWANLYNDGGGGCFPLAKREDSSPSPPPRRRPKREG